MTFEINVDIGNVETDYGDTITQFIEETIKQAVLKIVKKEITEQMKNMEQKIKGDISNILENMRIT